MNPEYDRNGIQLYRGDCAAVLSAVNAKANLILTSPPYDALRDYGGHPFDFNAVARACAAALAEGGVLVWIVADARVNGAETGTSMRQALAFMELGLTLHDTMAYVRKGNNGITNQGRHWRAWQYMFVLVNGAKPATANIICDYPRSEKTSVGWHKSGTVRLPNGVMKRQHPRRTPALLPRPNIWVYDAGYNKCHPHSESLAHEHPATFPYQLAVDHIRTWTNADDIVVDPMCGSGTTLSAAIAQGRQGIGVEIHAPYLDIARRRLDIAAAHKANGVDPWGAQISKLF